VQALSEIAQGAGLSLVELSLQWLLSLPHVTAVTIGASKVEHMEQNLAACEGRLDQATLAACDEVWKSIRGSHFAYNR
ncbi:MAG: aldo/keto reductase, partial [Anaerolineae bacterium]